MSDFTAFLVAAIEGAYADGSFLALYTDATTEATFTGYARQELAFTAGVTSGSVSVTNDGATPVTITHAALFDADTAGNRLTAIKALAAPVVLAASDVISFPAGDVEFTS